MEPIQFDSKEFRELAAEQLNATQQALRALSQIQDKKRYKAGLLLKRMYRQLLCDREYKDFAKWVLEKLTAGGFIARPLGDFDPLEQVKQVLREGQYRLADRIVAKTFPQKDAQRIFMFASVPFYDVGGGQRSAQLSRTFSALGKQVYYFHAFPAPVTEMTMPLARHQDIAEAHIREVRSLMRPGDMAIFEVPCAAYAPYLRCAKEQGAYTVYEHIDNWDSSLGSEFYDGDIFSRFLAEADLITVTARMLGEKVAEKSSRPYLYLPNAVNTAVFEPARQYDKPSDLVLGRKKTLLYFGSLWGEWFDWDKIWYVARHCPGCSINLIGDFMGCREKRWCAPKNVHFLGPKKQTELPAYLAYTDIALLPFKNDEIGKYVSPLKIFEYLAMNVRVLATPLDDIQGYPNVTCSDTCEGWAEAVGQSLPAEDCRLFTAQHSWFARCRELLDRAGSIRRDYPSLSVIVLNHNNGSVIRRCVDSLLAHRGFADYEIIVVDNQSDDGSYEMLSRAYAGRITVLRNDKNGCSSGRNLGVRAAKGEYICFLDSDQWVISDLWLEGSLHILEQDSGVGAVSWAAGWFSPGSVRGPIGEEMAREGLHVRDYAYRSDIAYLGSGGLLMRKALFWEVGGFDEAYDPTCFEDTDLSLRIRHAGYELAYCPHIPIQHLPHQTTRVGSAEYAALFARNEQYFTQKWQRLHPALLEYYCMYL